MSKRDTYLKMTNDDLRAARVLTLAVKFFGAAGPVSASTIHADLYPELEDGSFKRQYLRDRELLSTFGIQVRQTGDDGIDTFWQVDEGASYVSGESLSEGDARLLYVLCHDLAYDQSFAYRDELRMALAKISQMYRGTAVPYSDTTPASQHKVLSVLVGCMGARHAVDATYLDAQGNRSKRRLAIFGSFGLRGNTYFVASRIEKNGTLTPDSIRTYRLDRFEKASEVSSTSYLVPADFNVSDYERLPFQIGAPAGEAGFVLSEPLNREVQRAMETQGTVDTTADGNRLWKVVYASEKSLAAWSIGAEIAGKSTSAKVRAAAAELLRATCALPIASAVVEYKGRRLLDGGITKMVPIERAIEKGCTKFMVITTKPRDYVRKPAAPLVEIMMKMDYSECPQAAKDYHVRHLNYNHQMDLVRSLADEKKAILMCPSKTIKVSRWKGDEDKCKELYQLGYDDMEAHREEILAFMERSSDTETE